MFEGCANKTGSITSGFKGKQASDVSLDEARTLLDRMRAVSAPVNPNRLGSSNTDELEDLGSYAKDTGTFTIRSDCEGVEIPFVIEAWARLTGERAAISVHVNRTPVTSEVVAYHSKTEMSLYNCGLSQSFAV